MARSNVLTGVVAAVLALGITPAYAQRTNSSGETTGTAVSRSGGDEGGGGGAVSRDSGSATGVSSTSSSDSSSGSGVPGPATTGFDSVTRVTPPVHPAERQQRRGGSRNDGAREPSAREPSNDGPRAVPRGSSEPGGTGSRPSGSGRTAGGSSAEAGDSGSVPAYSRPRGSRPQTGTAVDRGSVVVPPGSRDIRTYYPVYPYGRYYWPGYGFGLGYFYDPLWYDPFYGGGHYGGGYYGGGSYGGGYQGGYGSAGYAKGPTGSLRLKIDPKNAEVYVDGYYAGIVDDFDGLFQRLTVEAGARRIEIRLAGYEPAEIELLVTPGETVTYSGELTRLP